MILTEYDEEETLRGLAEEHEEIGWKKGWQIGWKKGWEKGWKEGLAEGIEIGGLLKLAELVGDGTITLAKAAENAGMTVPEFKRRVAQLKKQTVGA